MLPPNAKASSRRDAEEKDRAFMDEQGDSSLARAQRLELHRKAIDNLEMKGCCAPRATYK